MDIKSKAKRSENMSRIRSRNTKPELFLRSLLHRHGFRYRVNYSLVSGRPDLYFTRKKVAVFVHGCFWHRHDGCKYAYMPKSNVQFWNEKFNKNLRRDSVVREQLKMENIRVLIVWECTVRKMMKDKTFEQNVLAEIKNFLELSRELYWEL